jgi:CBS domain-containing protein
MKAADVMVSAVISVGPNARVEEVAGILLANRISAVPVIDEQGELLGIVSEGDLMRRAEAGTDRSRSWWLEYLTGKQVLAAEYVKSHSHKVTDVMTRSVITATPETPLGEIATLLERNRIKRVPIMQNGKVVGVVSRANLLQALAGMPAKNAAAASAGDSQIRDEVLSRLNAQLWGPSMLNVTVRDGTVDLWGFVTSNDEKKATRIAVESVPGVKTINETSFGQTTTLLHERRWDRETWNESPAVVLVALAKLPLSLARADNTPRQFGPTNLRPVACAAFSHASASEPSP